MPPFVLPALYADFAAPRQRTAAQRDGRAARTPRRSGLNP